MPVLVAQQLQQALDALASQPTSLVLAGGTDAMVLINGGHVSPRNIISIARISELSGWSFDPQTQSLRLGACLTYHQLMQAPLAQWVPALAQAARTVGSPQIRHAATIGGNIATCSPAGDGLPVLAALDAIIHLQSSNESRDLPFTDFMVGPKRSDRRADELVVGVSVPVLDGWQGYAKVGVRNAMVISIAGACLTVGRAVAFGSVDGDASTASPVVRLALGSVGPTIVRCGNAEAFANRVVDFDQRCVSAADLQTFGAIAADECSPIDDHRSTAQYRRHAVAALAGRLLRRAFPNE